MRIEAEDFEHTSIMAPKEESYRSDNLDDLDEFTNYNAYVDVVKTLNSSLQKQKTKHSVDTLDRIVEKILNTNSSSVTACKLTVLWDFFPIFQASIVKQNSKILSICGCLISEFLSENSGEFDSESLTAALKITSFVFHEQNKLIDSARGANQDTIIGKIKKLVEHPYCLVETALIAGRTLVNLVLANSLSDEESLMTFVELLTEEEVTKYMQLVIVTGIVHVGGLHVLLVEEPASSKIFILYLFQFIKEFCSISNSYTFQSFHCLKMWSLRLKEICQKVASDSEENFRIHVEKPIVLDVVKILTTNWENPMRGVPDLCLQTFKYTLEVIGAAWKSENETEEYIDHLLSETMKLRWSQKSKYPQLNALMPAAGVQNCIVKFPDLPIGLSVSLASNHLTNAGMEVYKIVIADLDSESWCSSFGPVLVLSLTSDQPTIRQNCLNHWLPSTLRLQPQVISYLSRELRSNKSASGWIGRLSLLKLSRQLGLITSLDNDNFDCVSEGLAHTSPDVRSTAFAVLCQSKKLATPPQENELELLRSFVKENANVDCSKFRQSVGNSFSILLRRCRDYATQMYRNKMKGKESEKLLEIIDFLHELLNNVIDGLLPGGNYQRKISSLELLGIFIDLFFDFKCVGANKKSGNGDPKDLLMFASDLGKLNILTDHIMEVVVLNIVENMNDVREKAADVLAYFSPKTAFIDQVVFKMILLLNSPKYPECESGAILAKLIANWALNPDNETRQHLSQTILSNKPSMCHFLLTSYKRDFKNCESDFLSISRRTPMHGFMLALRRCLLDRNSLEKFSFKQNFLGELIQQIEDSVDFMLKVLSGDLQKENSNPSFQQMATAIDNLIALQDDGEDNAVEDNLEDTAIPEDHQLVLAAAWLNLKECAMMAGSLVSNLSLDIDPSPTSTSLSLENVGRCGDILLKILTNCRHKGAIVSANTACGLFFTRLLNSNNAQLRSLPEKYLDQVFDQLSVSFTSITRRSAGLPMLVQKLVGSEPRTRQRLLLPRAIKWLLDMTKGKPATKHEENLTDEDETKDVPRSHSLHILRGLAHDASTSMDIAPFILDIVAACVASFSNKSWAVRNAGLQLWGALAPRILGQKKVREEELGYGNLDVDTEDCSKEFGSYNVVSYKEVASRHPGIFKLFLERLRLAGEESKSTLVDAALIPILSLLSRIDVGSKEDGLECYEEIRDILRTFLASPVINVRTLSAKTLVSLTEKSPVSLTTEVNFVIGHIASSGNHNANQMHGWMMFLKLLVLSGNLREEDSLHLENMKIWLKSIRSQIHCYVIKIEVDSLLKIFNLEGSDADEDLADYSPGYFQWKQSRPGVDSLADLSLVSTFQDATQYLNTIKSNKDNTISAKINAITNFLDQSVEAAYCNGLLVSNALGILMEKDVLGKLISESEAAMDVLFTLEHKRFKSGEFGLTSETKAMFIRANCLNGMMIQDDWEMFFRDSSEYVSTLVEMSESISRHSEASRLETSRIYAAKSLVSLLPTFRSREIKEKMPLVLQYGFVNLVNSALVLLQDEDSDIRMEATKFGSGLPRSQWPEMVKWSDISTHLAIKAVVCFGLEQLAEVVELFIPFTALFVNPFKCSRENLDSIRKSSYLFEKGDGVNVYEEEAYMLRTYKECFIESAVTKKIDLKVSFEQGDLLSLGEALVKYLEHARSTDEAVFGKERTKSGYKLVVGVLNMIGLVLQFDLIKGGIEDDTKNKLTIVNKHLGELILL